MKRPRKVVHVELREPYLGKCHYYFGSVSAIYDVLPADVVGLSKASLWNVLKDGEHSGRKSVIRCGLLYAKPSNRGILKSDKQE